MAAEWGGEEGRHCGWGILKSLPIFPDQATMSPGKTDFSRPARRVPESRGPQFRFIPYESTTEKGRRFRRFFGIWLPPGGGTPGLDSVFFWWQCRGRPSDGDGSPMIETFVYRVASLPAGRSRENRPYEPDLGTRRAGKQCQSGSRADHRRFRLVRSGSAFDRVGRRSSVERAHHGPQRYREITDCSCDPLLQCPLEEAVHSRGLRGDDWHPVCQSHVWPCQGLLYRRHLFHARLFSRG